MVSTRQAGDYSKQRGYCEQRHKGMKEHSDFGEQQGVEWGRSLGKEKRAGQVQAMEGSLNSAMELELCLVGNREPSKCLG